MTKTRDQKCETILLLLMLYRAETTYPLTIILPQAPGKLEITVSMETCEDKEFTGAENIATGLSP